VLSFFLLCLHNPKIHIIEIMAQPTMESSPADGKVEVINDTHGTNIDPVAEKKLLRKCDIRVLPPLFVLFLLAFLDRTNIGTVFTNEIEITTPGLISGQEMLRFRA
jgi:hypothetical protein